MAEDIHGILQRHHRDLNIIQAYVADKEVVIDDLKSQLRRCEAELDEGRKKLQIVEDDNIRKGNELATKDAELQLARAQYESDRQKLSQNDNDMREMLTEIDELTVKLERSEQFNRDQAAILHDLRSKLQSRELARNAQNDQRSTTDHIDDKSNSRDRAKMKAIWAERVTCLARENPQGFHIQQLFGLWSQKWPGDAMESYYPQRGLKKCVVNHVPDVEVDKDDQIRPKVKQEVQSQIAASSRSRSRSPRKNYNPCDVISDDEDTMEVTQLTSHQVKLLQRLQKGGSQEHDPSANKSALWTYSHLVQKCNVKGLRFTHSTISSKFRHGTPYPVTVLRDRLISGHTDVREITPPVVGKLDGNLWVIYGNRRLKAVKDFAETCPERIVAMDCIVHDFADTRIPPPVHLIAKFVLASSTETDGNTVQMRPRSDLR